MRKPSRKCRNCQCKSCENDNEVLATTQQPNGMVDAGGATTETEHTAAGEESANGCFAAHDLGEKS